MEHANVNNFNGTSNTDKFVTRKNVFPHLHPKLEFPHLHDSSQNNVLFGDNAEVGFLGGNTNLLECPLLGGLMDRDSTYL